MNKITLVSHTPHPLECVIGAYRKCYQSEEKSDSEHYDLGPKDEAMLKKAISHGHESPLEHVSCTFDIKTSRACQTQLIRHRLASFSIESQRYCKPTGYFTPDLTEQQMAVYVDAIAHAWRSYDALIEVGVKKEDARYVLPMATLGEIRFTMNLRELRHFIAERTCTHAQGEIRNIALKVKEMVACIHPIFVYRCEKYWRCIDADKCGKCLGVAK